MGKKKSPRSMRNLVRGCLGRGIVVGKLPKPKYGLEIILMEGSKMSMEDNNVKEVKEGYYTCKNKG